MALLLTTGERKMKLNRVLQLSLIVIATNAVSAAIGGQIAELQGLRGRV